MSTNTGGPGRTYKYLQDPSLALWPFAFGLSYTTFSVKHATITNTNTITSRMTNILASLRTVPTDLRTDASTEGVPLADTAWASTAYSHARAPAAARRALGERLRTERLATVNVTVTNTGTVEGDEVVFLFQNASHPAETWNRAVSASAASASTAASASSASSVSSVSSASSASSASSVGGEGTTMVTHNKQLIGYERVSLQPGQSAVVTFELTAELLSTVDIVRLSVCLLP